MSGDFGVTSFQVCVIYLDELSLYKVSVSPVRMGATALAPPAAPPPGLGP